MRKRIDTDRAPKAIGPYSQGIVANGFIFCSGQMPIDPATGELVHGGIREQTARVIENLAAVLREGGARIEDVVKTTVYLKDLGEFQAMNEVYARYFGKTLPARATVEVSRLPREVRVEIDCVAALLPPEPRA